MLANVYVGMRTLVSQHVCHGNFVDSVSSSYFYMGSGHELRPLGLHDKCLYPLRHRAILRFIEFPPLFLQLGSLSYPSLTIFSILEFQGSGVW